MNDLTTIWWVIHGAEILDGLRRAAAGEDPNLLYFEMYVNAEDHTDDEAAPE